MARAVRKLRPKGGICLKDLMHRGLTIGPEAVTIEEDADYDFFAAYAQPRFRILDFAREVFGVKGLTPDQLKMVGSISGGNTRVCVYSGNGLGKTFVFGIVAQFFYNCVGSIRGDNGVPQGCKVVLSGPAYSTVANTSWPEMRRLKEVAEGKGIKLLGKWSDAGNASKVAEARSDWTVTVSTPKPRASSKVASAASGQHSKIMFVWIEESPGVSDPNFHSLNMLATGEENYIVALGNPTDGTTGWYHDACTDEDSVWIRHQLSNLNHPNVRRRNNVIHGAITYQGFENDIRKRCSDLGLLSEYGSPDKKKGQFAYALPPRGVIVDGARPDGMGAPHPIPLRVYQATGLFFPQQLGMFPPDSVHNLFSGVNWEECTKAWEYDPDSLCLGPPAVIGCDPADTGGDSPMIVPRWGYDAETLLIEWYANVNSRNPVSAEQFRQDYPCYVGKPVALKNGTGEDLADQVEKMYPGSRIVLDRGGVGASAMDFMTSKGMNVMGAFFSQKPRPRVDSELYSFNLRAQMYFRASMLVRNGLVCIQPDKELEREARQIKKEEMARRVPERGVGNGRTEMKTVYKVQSKEELREKIGRSTDRADAFVMALHTHSRKSQVLS